MTLNVKVPLPIMLLEFAMYNPESSGINEVRCMVENTGENDNDGLFVTVTLSAPEVKMLSSWLHVMSVRGTLNLVISTERVILFPAGISSDLS